MERQLSDDLLPLAVELSPMSRADVGAVLGVLSRGMRDNPLHVAAFGEDPDTRERKLRQFFGLRGSTDLFLQNTVVARLDGGAIVGVYSAMAPGTCTPSVPDPVKMVPGLVRMGPGTATRVARWFATWGKHDPSVRHWHLGPFAIDISMQRQGPGSTMMRDFCARMDDGGDAVYLETDRAGNVDFYRRFGFEIVEELSVIGVPNWCMLRTPVDVAGPGSAERV